MKFEVNTHCQPRSQLSFFDIDLCRKQIAELNYTEGVSCLTHKLNMAKKFTYTPRNVAISSLLLGFSAVLPSQLIPARSSGTSTSFYAGIDWRLTGRGAAPGDAIPVRNNWSAQRVADPGGRPGKSNNIRNCVRLMS